MNNGKKFALRMAALMLCLFTISATLSSCGFFVDSYLENHPWTDPETKERVEKTSADISTEEEYTSPEEGTAAGSNEETANLPETTKIDETTKPSSSSIPETTKTPETTKAPETTKTPETTLSPEQLDNIPDDVQKNVYLTFKDAGKCAELVGKVNVIVLLINDDVSAWTDGSLAALSTSLSKQEKEIEKVAGTYGKMLDMTFSYYSLKISGDAAAGDYSDDWLEEAAKTAGYSSLAAMQKDFMTQTGADSCPILFAMHKAGRAYAHYSASNTSAEYLVVFATDTTSFTHELYHVYGARDFYYPKDVKELADTLLGESVMQSGSRTDPLTAFIIGWDDEIDNEAYEFLKQTSHLTQSFLDDENKKQAVTGNVTNYELSYGIYTGHLERGIPDGYGEITYTEGDQYKGYFDGGTRHGKGTYIYKSGNVYEGDWVYNDRTGQGTFTFSSGTVYVGEFKNSKFEGKGKMTWSDGSYYEGDYKDGERHGKGTYHFANGTVYTGDWVMGKRTGQGTYTSPNGFIYNGGFNDGQYNGYGEVKYTDGATYKGNFANGLRHGEGTYTYPAGHVYTGQWEDGNRTGSGYMTWADGSSYNGEWKNNKRHGYGKYIHSNGQTFEGQWQNDVFKG